MNKQVILKKDFSCFVETKMVRFKKGEILALDHLTYRTLDGRQIPEETVRFFNTHFKILEPKKL